MPIHINVTTYNECSTGGGFHELHEAKFLSSPQHALEIIKSVLDLNIQFCGSCILTGADIECSDTDTLSLVRNHYAREAKIKVYVDKLRQY